MATYEEMIRWCDKNVGTVEKYNNNVIYNTRYYGRTVSGSSYPWCMAFIWCMMVDLKEETIKTAYCPTFESWLKNKGYKVDKYDIPVGGIVFFDFRGLGRASHVGRVVEVLGHGKYKTIEGNTSTSNQSNGGMVMYRIRYASDIRSAFRVPISNSITLEVCGMKKLVVREVKNGSKGSSVRLLQEILNERIRRHGWKFAYLTVDGDYGANTEAVIKWYQKQRKLTADGVCGANTWADILGLEAIV